MTVIEIDEGSFSRLCLNLRFGFERMCEREVLDLLEKRPRYWIPSGPPFEHFESESIQWAAVNRPIRIWANALAFAVQAQINMRLIANIAHFF